MAGTTFEDHFSADASRYAKHRPTYPDGLFQYLASVCPSGDVAWDCATGSGQAAAQLANHFNHVIATDASHQQLAQAVAHERVSYRPALAEQSGLYSHSVALVTVAQALHWFDIPRFFDEAKRVLKKNGVLAVWCYSWVHTSPPIDVIVHHLYRDILGPYWPPQRQLVQDRYQTIDFPVRELEPPPFEMSARWSLEAFVEYLRTWCAVRRYTAVNYLDPIAPLAPRLLEAWGNPQQERRVSWDFTLRVGTVD